MIQHIINIFVASLIATVFLFPVSALDTYFFATINKHNVYLTIGIILICDVITAILAYKLSYWLIPKIIRKEKTKNKFIKVGKKLDKWGWFVVVIAAATPFPYTLTIYSAGAINWGNNFKLGSAIAFGKLIRYSAYAFGFKMII